MISGSGDEKKYNGRLAPHMFVLKPILYHFSDFQYIDGLYKY